MNNLPKLLQDHISLVKEVIETIGENDGCGGPLRGNSCWRCELMVRLENSIELLQEKFFRCR